MDKLLLLLQFFGISALTLVIALFVLLLVFILINGIIAVISETKDTIKEYKKNKNS